ncbi:hypothetical protein BDR05DRAFT_1004971 [Suillus weaverae]|nr:hypothetical protein BDR05DRAFT_1004971 [Suillus weaverae]
MANITASANNAWTSILNIFKDVVFIDIQNTISLNNTYCFNLNLDSPSPKKIVFASTNRLIIRTQFLMTWRPNLNLKKRVMVVMGMTEMKTEDVEVRIDEVKVEDEDLVISPDFEPVVASPCNLLTRCAGNPNPDPENPTAPWSYYVKKRTKALEDQDEISVDGLAASL